MLLNGQPLSVRGLLNWGYQPGRSGPTIDAATMRQELEFARERGFQLGEVLPLVSTASLSGTGRRVGHVYLDGVSGVASPVYPAEHLDDLRREYNEFFFRHRHHPSVILRSLHVRNGSNCRSGSDSIAVRRVSPAGIPRAMVEDDSSWIDWNRVHDFYDDHPYGNNHTWPAKLAELNAYIAARQPLPLMLGEAIAADTWYGPAHATAPTADPPAPPIFAEGNRQWRREMSPLVGADALSHLRDDSLKYALLMRKYQIETFRRDMPAAGYVVSVIRDFPLAGMGLIDYFGRPKWSPAEWAWHGPTMLLLRTDDDRRSWIGGQTLAGEVIVSHLGPEPLAGAKWSVAMTGVGPVAVDVPLQYKSEPLSGSSPVFGSRRRLSNGPRTSGSMPHFVRERPHVEQQLAFVAVAPDTAPGVARLAFLPVGGLGLVRRGARCSLVGGR